MTHIEQPIKDYIVNEFLAGQPRQTVANDDLLIQEGVIDSLGIFLLIAFIEKQFGVKIEPAEVVLENFETVNAITGLIASKTAART